ncbi:hypothetical protein SLEP1_g41809 [Rubroshorea leprosula]|uniref:Uncharacterized protein n=1 Tax=Rubroshorea leprosula TaxID=152421 RepID=A0AAV5L8P8_9ROSI|nr:hypothetical protein SLEP1_g41809 [Rubroshorea leprosula]
MQSRKEGFLNVNETAENDGNSGFNLECKAISRVDDEHGLFMDCGPVVDKCDGLKEYDGLVANPSGMVRSSKENRPDEDNVGQLASVREIDRGDLMGKRHRKIEGVSKNLGGVGAVGDSQNKATAREKRDGSKGYNENSGASWQHVSFLWMYYA